MQPRTARIVLAVYLGVLYSTLGVVRLVSSSLRDRGALRPTILTLFVLAAGSMVFLVFRERRNRSWKVVAALVIALMAYAAVIVPMDMPEEKIHFIEYGLVGLLVDLATSRSWTARRRYLFSSVFVLAAGWIDEIIQGILPNRYYDLRDVAFNTAAGMMALTLLAALRVLTRSREATRSPS